MNSTHDISDEHVFTPDEKEVFAKGIGAVKHLAWRLNEVSYGQSVDWLLASACTIGEYSDHPEQYLGFATDDEAWGVYDQTCATLTGKYGCDARDIYQFFLFDAACIIAVHSDLMSTELDPEYDWQGAINTATALAYRLGKPFSFTADEMDFLLDERIAEIITRDALRTLETRAG
jgi:hypothetical protein